MQHAPVKEYLLLKSKLLLVSGIMLLFTLPSLIMSAQPPIIEWQSSFKTSVYGIANGERCPNNRDWFYNIIEVSAAKGGGYLGVGYSEMTKCENSAIAKLESYVVNGATYYKQLKVYTPTIVRMDAHGKMLWEQIFNKPYPCGKSYFSDVVEVADGFVACGSKLQAQNENETLSVNNTQMALLIGKVNENGKIATGFPKIFGQQYIIGDSATVAVSTVLPFSTGGYCSIRKVPNSEKGFIIGTADFSDKQAALIRLDENGNLYGAVFGDGVGYKTWGIKTGNANGWMTARYFKNDASEGFLLAEAQNSSVDDIHAYDIYVASIPLNGAEINWEQTYDSNPKGRYSFGDGLKNSHSGCTFTFNDRATDMELLPGGKEAVVNAFCQYAYGCGAANNFYGYESSPGKFSGTDVLFKIDITNEGKGKLKWCKTIGPMDGIDFNPTIVLSKDKSGSVDGIIITGNKVYAKANGTSKNGIKVDVYKTTPAGLACGNTTAPDIAWNQSYQGNGFINSVFGSDFCANGGIVLAGNNERINGDYLAIKINAATNFTTSTDYSLYTIVLLVVLVLIILFLIYKKKHKY